MNKTLRFLSGASLVVLLLAQFNNCSSYTPAVGLTGEDSVSCTTPNCIVPIPSALTVVPHVANGQEPVTAGVAEFNIGGDCNEAGFPYNEIRWELVLNGVTVRTSDMPVAGGSPATSACVNGRFLLYVNLAALSSGDTINRTGLLSPTGRSAYTLNIILYGTSTANAAISQWTQSVSVIQLTAI